LSYLCLAFGLAAVLYGLAMNIEGKMDSIFYPILPDVTEGSLQDLSNRQTRDSYGDGFRSLIFGLAVFVISVFQAIIFRTIASDDGSSKV